MEGFSKFFDEPARESAFILAEGAVEAEVGVGRCWRLESMGRRGEKNNLSPNYAKKNNLSPNYVPELRITLFLTYSFRLSFH